MFIIYTIMFSVMTNGTINSRSQHTTLILKETKTKSSVILMHERCTKETATLSTY